MHRLDIYVEVFTNFSSWQYFTTTNFFDNMLRSHATHENLPKHIFSIWSEGAAIKLVGQHYRVNNSSSSSSEGMRETHD